ncbi:MAG: adenine deaminase [Thermodesulfobacteriota bacterium]|nr:adenine deaminase [Thermodesulfobacteriota bacterium]
MKRDRRSLERLLRVAAGEVPAECCLRGGSIVNVHTGAVERADLAVHDGCIVGIGRYEARREVDASGLYIAPGFIDGHIHIESSLLHPAGFAAAVLPRGTTAVVCDPHEIANVFGVEGIRYFLQATERLPLEVYLTLPSCVPASPLETSGAALSAADLASLLPHPRIVGLGEMMNFPGVLAAVPDVLEKLVLFQDLHMDGHAPLLTGNALNAYALAGIATDHESTQLEEAREKLARGLRLMIREGSQSRDMAALLPAVSDATWPSCLLVTDDRHPDDLLHGGHMDALVNRAVDLGLDPVRAIAMASRTPAETFGLKRRGALVPGARADFSLSASLHPWEPVSVYKNGLEAVRDGKVLVDLENGPSPAPPPSPMELGPISADLFALSGTPDREVKVIEVVEGSLLTRCVHAVPKTDGGRLVADTGRDILKLAVFNRYGPRTAQPRRGIGFVKGFGLTRGALASTIAHDSHNLIAVGASDAAMAAVCEAVRRVGGGLGVGDASGTLELLPLPIAGLMSLEPLDAVVDRLAALRRLARAFGCALRNPFMALSFLALPVIPELKLTDRGLVNVASFSMVSLQA